MGITMNDYREAGVHTASKTQGRSQSASAGSSVHASGESPSTTSTSSAPAPTPVPAPVITQALSDAGLTDNARNRQIVSSLIAQELPIDAETLKSVARALSSYPNESVESVVLLRSACVEITPSSLEDANAFLAARDMLLDSLGDIGSYIESSGILSDADAYITPSGSMAEASLASQGEASELSGAQTALTGVQGSEGETSPQVQIPAGSQGTPALPTEALGTTPGAPEQLSALTPGQDAAGVATQGSDTATGQASPAEASGPSALSPSQSSAYAQSTAVQDGQSATSGTTQNTAVADSQIFPSGLTQNIATPGSQGSPSASAQSTAISNDHSASGILSQSPTGSVSDNGVTVSDSVQNASGTPVQATTEASHNPQATGSAVTQPGDTQTAAPANGANPPVNGAQTSNPTSAQVPEGQAAFAAASQTDTESSSVRPLSQLSFKELVSALSEKPGLEASDIFSEGIKRFIESAVTYLENAREVSHRRGDEAMAAKVDKAMNSMRTMLKLNDMYAYAEVPIKNEDEEKKTHLRFFANKKTRIRKDEGSSAVLHLNMPSLKELDIRMVLKGNSLRVDFFSSKDASKLLESESGTLSERLSAIGVDPTMDFHERVKEPTPGSSILQSKTQDPTVPAQGIRGFDTRA